MSFKGDEQTASGPSLAGGILRKYHGQHSWELLPACSKVLDAKESFPAAR